MKGSVISAALLLGFATVSCLLGACGFDVNYGTMTAASVYKVPIRAQTLAKGVTGEDCVSFIWVPALIISIPPRPGLPSVSRAMDSALKAVPDGDAMKDVVIEERRFDLPFLIVNYFKRCLVVSGDIVKVDQRR